MAMIELLKPETNTLTLNFELWLKGDVWCVIWKFENQKENDHQV